MTQAMKEVSKHEGEVRYHHARGHRVPYPADGKTGCQEAKGAQQSHPRVEIAHNDTETSLPLLLLPRRASLSQLLY